MHKAVFSNYKLNSCLCNTFVQNMFFFVWFSEILLQKQKLPKYSNKIVYFLRKIYDQKCSSLEDICNNKSFLHFQSKEIVEWFCKNIYYYFLYSLCHFGFWIIKKAHFETKRSIVLKHTFLWWKNVKIFRQKKLIFVNEYI